MYVDNINYIIKLYFLGRAKTRARFYFENLAESPHGMSTEQRDHFRLEADRSDRMFDLIAEDIARLRDLDK